MCRQHPLSAVALFALLLAWPANPSLGEGPGGEAGKERWLQVRFNYTFNPVEMVVGRLLDAFVIDPVLVGLGWKEGQGELDKRLQREIEKNSAALKSEQREKLRELREEIRKCASRDDLKTLAARFKNELREVNRRLDSAEENIEWLNAKDEDRDNGTKNRNDPKHFVARGERYLAQKEHFQALACARIAGRLDEKFPEAYLLQGRVYAARGAADVAQVCFDQAIQVAPSHAPCYRVRGDARLAADRPAEAAADYGRAVELDPKDGWSWAHRAAARMALSEYRGAYQDADRALKLNPADHFARLQRARAYTGRRPGTAVGDFEQYIREMPEDPEGYVCFGFFHFQGRNYDRALQNYEQALKLNPHHGPAHCHLTQLWYWKGEYAKAVVSGKRAVELAPQSWWAHYEYGNALWQTGKLDAALKQFKESISHNARDAWGFAMLAYRHCGRIHSAKGQHGEAIACFDEALKRNPDDTEVMYFRAAAHNRLRNHDQAIADATAAIKLDPDACDAFFERGYARHEKKQYTEAVADYTEVIRLNPNHTMAFCNRGAARTGLRQFDKAVEDYGEALRLDPNFALARANRAQLNGYSRGRRFEAELDYEKLLKDPKWKDTAMLALFSISPNNAELLKALPAGANGYGTYSVLRRVVHAPDDKKRYGDYRNYGYSSKSEYGIDIAIPAGYWVYVAPNWYIWANKK